MTFNKRKDSGSSGDVPELGEFSIDYLKKKYPHEAYEYSYSIHDSFEKYSHELIKFYQGVLNGDVSTRYCSTNSFKFLRVKVVLRNFLFCL